jgi:hypothetical protein
LIDYYDGTEGMDGRNDSLSILCALSAALRRMRRDRRERMEWEMIATDERRIKQSNKPFHSFDEQNGVSSTHERTHLSLR